MLTIKAYQNIYDKSPLLKTLIPEFSIVRTLLSEKSGYIPVLFNCPQILHTLERLNSQKSFTSDYLGSMSEKWFISKHPIQIKASIMGSLLGLKNEEIETIIEQVCTEEPDSKKFIKTFKKDKSFILNTSFYKIFAHKIPDHISSQIKDKEIDLYRLDKFKSFMGKIAELMYADHLDKSGWQITNLEAWDKNSCDIEASKNGRSFNFEIKYIGPFIEEALIRLFSNGIGYTRPFEIFDYIKARLEDTLKNSVFAQKENRIGVILVDAYDNPIFHILSLEEKKEKIKYLDINSIKSTINNHLQDVGIYLYNNGNFTMFQSLHGVLS